MSLPKTYVEGFHDLEAVKNMKYRKFGNSDMELSLLSFGGGGLSGFYEEFRETEGIELVKEAVRKGINYIDTAPFYGEGRSETTIGKALREIPRQSYFISTKVGRYSKNLEEMFNYSPEKIKSRFETSLQLLGIDYVDIIILHDVEFAKMSEILEKSLPALREIVESGKARYLGISGFPLSRIWDVITRTDVHLDAVLTYSRDTMIDATLKEYYHLFKEKGLGVINAAPNSLQMLTNAGPQAWHPATDQLKVLCAQAAAYSQSKDVELGCLAIYHSLMSPCTETLLVGMNSKETLNVNLRIAIKGLTPAEKKVYDYLMTNIFNQKENLHWEGEELKSYNMTME